MQLRAAGEELTQFLIRVLTPESAHQSYVATRLVENPTAFYSMLFTVFDICLLKTKETITSVHHVCCKPKFDFFLLLYSQRAS